MDSNLSYLSDLAFEGAMAGYLVALVCHAVEAASRRARRITPELAMAGAGRGYTATSPAAAEGGPDTGEARRTYIADRIGRAAVVVTAVGFACHVLTLVFRGFAAERLPWGNMYEFTLMITGAAVAAWLVVLVRSSGARLMGVFVMTPVVVLLFLAGTVLYTQVAPLQPILKSYWYVIHVAVISLSSGVLMLAGLASVAYLVRARHDARVEAGLITDDGSVAKLPSRDKLDRIAYRATVVAFPFFTFGIIAGALWGEVAWGSYWSWDPKETVALVSWVVYAGYLHARATAGWRGKPAAWISVVGLATMIFNLFFVNMVVSGLHSYAGLN